jgi:chromosome segregation ATPase
MESSARRRRKSSHRECFKILDKYEEQVEGILAEREDDRTATAKLIQELNTDKAREISNVPKFIAEKDTAVAEIERLKKETSQLQLQLESTNTTLQDQVAWDDIQPILHQTHGELISAVTRFGNLIESLQNKRLASFLPSTEVFHGNWATTADPSEPTDPNALPGFSGSSNPPLFDPQALTSTNEYGPFA